MNSNKLVQQEKMRRGKSLVSNAVYSIMELRLVNCIEITIYSPRRAPLVVLILIRKLTFNGKTKTA